MSNLTTTMASVVGQFTAANCSKPIDISIYKCSDRGIALPIMNEYTWPIELRGFLYIVGLLYCFLGVAIIADVFMCAIEKITSKTRMIKVAKPGTGDVIEEIEVKVWNDTVANLTLMALGSSAPEILLSIIEIVGKNFKAGALGPSTIVGSAAFNLFVIIAVCIISIPNQETRRIQHVKVFGVTAFSSIFAYVWLIFILVGHSANVVDLWEAIITLLFFPALVIIAYLADKNFCGKKHVESEVELGFDAPEPEYHGRMTFDQMAEFMKEVGKNPDLTEEDVAKMAATKISENQQHNSLWYRINAVRNIGGANKLKPSMNEALTGIYEEIKQKPMGSEMSVKTGPDVTSGGKKAVIEFAATSVAIMENEKKVGLTIKRTGKRDNRVIVKVETIDGTAEAGSDYIAYKGSLVFDPQEAAKQIEIEIIDDNQWEPDEVFFVRLSFVDVDDSEIVLGKKSVCQVTIVNDDEPGVIEFVKPSFLVKETTGNALIPIQRTNGADGKVSVVWKTEDMGATHGSDYDGGEGVIVFDHGEIQKMLEIAIYDDQTMEKDENFKIELIDPTGGAKLGRIRKTVVTIVNDEEYSGIVSRLVNMTNENLEALTVETHTWQEQFHNAMNVNGGDVENSTSVDYVMHFLTFGWKVIFAIVPPVSMAGGWLAFFVALSFIGILTLIIGDLASIFGCLIGLDDEITAITFVALGTSLPDLFASKTAATQEKTADNSIGNVTGSNSVNVFLGLGLPWVIASIYWASKGKSFEVPAKSLSFSVTIYAILGVVCLVTVILRRLLGPLGKGELGGPKVPKMVTGCFFIFLWVLYLLLASLNVKGIIPNL